MTDFFTFFAYNKGTKRKECKKMKDYGLPKINIKEQISRFFENDEKIRRAASIFSPIVFSLILSSAKMPLATYPLGFSLLAAGAFDTVFFYIGSILLSLLSGRWHLAVGYTALIVFRFVFSKVMREEKPLLLKRKKELLSLEGAFCEGEHLKSAVAALGAFTSGMLATIAGGFSFGDLMGTIFCIVVCPCVTYIYSGYFSAVEKSGLRYECGYMALLVSLIFALDGIDFFGISLSVIAASLFSFLLAKSRSPIVAGLFALISVILASPMLSPAFAVSAMLAGMLYVRSKLYSVCVSAISFASLTYFIGGLPLFASSFPEFLAGALLSLPIKKEFCERFLPFFGREEEKKIAAEAQILTHKEQKVRESISDISESFEQLSKTFFDLSDRNTRIGIFDTRQICDRVCDRYCRRCAARELCWERNYAVTLDTINKISAKIYKSGRVETADLPPEFLSRCPNTEKLLSDIEKENTKVLRSLLKEDKTRAFAVDYAVFSRILSEALEKNEVEYAPNSKARAAVKAALGKIGFYADTIGVYGARCKKVYAYRLSREAMKCKAEDIKNTLGEALGGRCEDPIFEFSDGGINMTLKSAPIIKADCSVYALSAKHGEENGDSVSFFEGKNGFCYAILNDGMGSGRAAAKKSRAAAIFLEKMLRAGNSVSSGVEMLSALERADGEEGFTTLDLFEIDTLTANASFVKSGAAPSFVKRGTKLFKIRSKTFPLGILEDVDAERTTFSLSDGDRIVMLSDGVTEENEEPLWLCEFLTETDLTSPDAAEKIIAEAKKHTLGRDDMSAAVIAISKI